MLNEFSLEKKIKGFADQYLTPKFLLRYSPGNMRKENGGNKLNTADLFSLNRLNNINNFENGFNAIVLDGDNTRLGINKDLGFTEQDRIENIRRVAEISKLFTETGHIAINAFISPFKTNRTQARDIISDTDFIEVYI